MQGRSLCPFCVYLSEDGTNTCKAFPAGIPDEIIHGGFDHRGPYDGDNGVRFEADPDFPPERIATALDRPELPPTR